MNDESRELIAELTIKLAAERLKNELGSDVHGNVRLLDLNKSEAVSVFNAARRVVIESELSSDTTRDVMNEIRKQLDTIVEMND